MGRRKTVTRCRRRRSSTDIPRFMDRALESALDSVLPEGVDRMRKTGEESPGRKHLWKNFYEVESDRVYEVELHMQYLTDHAVDAPKSEADVRTWTVEIQTGDGAMGLATDFVELNKDVTSLGQREMEALVEDAWSDYVMAAGRTGSRNLGLCTDCQRTASLSEMDYVARDVRGKLESYGETLREDFGRGGAAKKRSESEKRDLLYLRLGKLIRWLKDKQEMIR